MFRQPLPRTTTPSTIRSVVEKDNLVRKPEALRVFQACQLRPSALLPSLPRVKLVLSGHLAVAVGPITSPLAASIHSQPWASMVREPT